MSDDKSDMSQSFEHSKGADRSKDKIDPNTPDMIKNHEPVPELTPDYDTSGVDRDHFDNGLQKDREKFKQTSQKPDGFDRVDQQKEWSQRLGKDNRDVGRSRD